MDLYDEFLGLVGILEKHGLDYALCGGIAVAIYGYARFTKDIDLLVKPEDIDQMLSAVKERDFDLDSGRLPFGVGGPNHREVHRISKIEENEVLTLDLLLVSQVLEVVWEGREVIEWNGRKIQIVSLQGLATMKRMAGRPEDLLDLEKLGVNDPEEDGDA